MTCYTAINIPYGALGAVMTNDPTERASLQSYRFAMAMAALLIIVWALPKLVAAFGQGDDAAGYPLAMVFLGSLAAACFLACFKMTKETTQVELKKKKNPFSDFLSLFKNDQWLVIAIISLVTLTLIGIRSAVAPHYVKYYIGDESLLSNFLTLAAVGSVLGAVSTNFLTKFFEKKMLFQIALVTVIISHGLFYVIDASQIALIFIIYFIANFAHMVITPIMFSMVADTVDYGAMKSGKRLTAVAFSGHLLAIKFGLAIGGALAGWILSGYGYVANQEQSAETLSGILFAFAGIPMICTILSLIFIARYKLTVVEVKRIQSELTSAKSV